MTEQNPDLYSFEFKGETYTFERPFSVVRAPRWLRANRRRDELDLAFSIIEEIAGDEVLEVVDSMDESDFELFAVALKGALNASFR